MKCPFMKRLRKDGTTRVVPCGKCEICKDNRRRDYTVRLNLAYQQHLSCFFITLTFAEENLPEDRENCIRLFQLYMKRLRKAGLLGKNVKYFSVLERGDINKRYHWHQLLFFEIPKTKEEVLQIIVDAWQYGIVDVGYLQPGGISYLTKYLFKDDYKMLVSRGLGYPSLEESSIQELVRGYKINGYQYSKPQSIVNKISRSNRELFHYYQEFKEDYYNSKISPIRPLETREEALSRYQRYLDGKIAKDLVYRK